MSDTQNSEDAVQADVPAPADSATGEAELGDAGKRALAALRAEVKELRAELKKAKSADSEGQRDAAPAEGDTSEGRDAAEDADSDASATPVATVRPHFEGTADNGAFGRSAPSAGQLSRDELKRMSPRQIADALRAGRLTDILKGRD